MPAKTTGNRPMRKQRLQNKFTYKEPGMFCFKSDGKNLDEDCRNDRWLCRVPRRSNVIHTKSAITVIVLEVISNVVQTPHFFFSECKRQCCRLYGGVERIVRPRIQSVSKGRLHTYEQDCAVLQGQTTQECMIYNPHGHVTLRHIA